MALKAFGKNWLVHDGRWFLAAEERLLGNALPFSPGCGSERCPEQRGHDSEIRSEQ
jgi:hypothetical protein